jgi:predicted DNA binding CopG/RHH family protein
MPNVLQQLFIMNIDSLLREYAAYKTFNKSDCVINMRIPKPVLDKIKQLAEQQHVPYQSLISSVLFSLANVEDK